MSIARIYINEDAFSFSGNVQDSFEDFTATSDPARDRSNRPIIEPKTKTLSVDNLKFRPGEELDFRAFANSCDALTGFSLKLTYGEECADGTIEYDYTGCTLEGGSLVWSPFENQITGFVAAYENSFVNTV